jgi:hypothetical protein
MYEVIVDANKKVADTGDLLLGLGNSTLDNKGIVLQHKTETIYYESLSQYVYEREFKNLNSSQCCQRIFVEDFSVDTILSIWIFLHKKSNHDIPKNVLNWINYACKWEKGDTTTTGKAFESYGCLQNALVLNMKNHVPLEILTQSLAFLSTLIRQKTDPAKIGKLTNNTTYRQAYESLEKEYKKYQSLLHDNEIIKLFIPHKESGEPIELSGIFIETEIISSIQKVFLRNDEEYSPTHNGFAFMAVYNAKAEGTGNDIVISVDPLKNVHLKSLWSALEKEENLLWGKSRPRDNPRPLKSYPHNNGPNEPWWDDMGKYTLIAAPKKVGVNFGRKVSFEKVIELIQQLYRRNEND